MTFNTRKVAALTLLAATVAGSAQAKPLATVIDDPDLQTPTKRLTVLTNSSLIGKFCAKANNLSPRKNFTYPQAKQCLISLQKAWDATTNTPVKWAHFNAYLQDNGSGPMFVGGNTCNGLSTTGSGRTSDARIIFENVGSTGTAAYDPTSTQYGQCTPTTPNIVGPFTKTPQYLPVWGAPELDASRRPVAPGGLVSLVPIFIINNPAMGGAGLTSSNTIDDKQVGQVIPMTSDPVSAPELARFRANLQKWSQPKVVAPIF